LALAVGVDVGTSSIKAVLLDGLIISGSARAPLPRPRSTGDLQKAFVDLLESLLPEEKREHVRALCIGGRAPTVVGIRGDQQDGPVVGWEGSPATATRSRFYLDSIAKSLMEHDRDLYNSCRFFVNPHEYLTYVLTGLVRSSTPSDLYHPWGGYVTEAKRRLKSARLDSSKVAPSVPVGSVVGRISSALALGLGLDETATVVMGGWDFFSDILGSAVSMAGEILVRAGTSIAVDALWSSPLDFNGFFTVPYFMSGIYVVGKVLRSAAEFTGHEERAPHSTGQEVFRPEDEAQEIADAVSRLRQEMGEPLSIVCSGQRALRTDMCRRLVSRIGRTVQRPSEPHTEARGAAVLASVASGLTATYEEHIRAIKSTWETIAG